MENYVAGQLAALGAAVALGAAGGLVYDLLRVLRRRRPGLTHAADAVFGGMCLLGALWALTRVGGGEPQLYLLLGAVGLPVFSGFGAGPGQLLGATGGYLVGFLCLALVCWLVTHFLDDNLWATALGMLLGLVVCYAFGTAWFLVVYARTSGPVGLVTALSWCVVPFVVPDCIKMALALLISRRLRPYVKL